MLVQVLLVLVLLLLVLLLLMLMLGAEQEGVAVMASRPPEGLEGRYSG